MSVRIIPRLDIKGPNLVKGIHLEGLRVLGKPERFAQYYYENGADELFYMDAVASLYERNSLVEIIRRTATDVAIPLTVGGGIRTVEDIREVLRAGADKVAINTAAIRRPEFIHEASRRFGSSTIVVSIEAIKQKDNTYEAYTDCGRERTEMEVLAWAQRAEDLGAGEIAITSVDREGTGNGFDIALTRSISESVSIPVIACGGAGSANHVQDVICDGKADAVCIASCLHYDFLRQYTPTAEDYASEGNTEFIRSQSTFSRIRKTSLSQIKQMLTDSNIDCRWN